MYSKSLKAYAFEISILNLYPKDKIGQIYKNICEKMTMIILYFWKFRNILANVLLNKQISMKWYGKFIFNDKAWF